MMVRNYITAFFLLTVSLVPLGCGQIGLGGGAISMDGIYVDARTALLQAAVSEDPVTRANAMEAIGRTLGPSSGGILAQGLDDENVTVRFAAAMAIGDMGYPPAEKRLIQLIEDPESDQRVVSAAIYALYWHNNEKYAGQLGTLLFSDFDLGRAAAAMAMGKMDESSAVGPLRSLLDEEEVPGVRVSILEALARLGDKASMQTLESYARGYFLDLRLAAIPALARTKTPRAEMVLEELLGSRNPPRVRIAAAGGLGLLGAASDRGYNLCCEALRDPEGMLRRSYGNKQINPVEVSSLRQLAEISLGQMKQEKAVYLLHPFLKDADGSVRVAAAMSILEILSSLGHTTDASVEPGSLPPAAPPGSLRKLQTSGGIDQFKSR